MRRFSHMEDGSYVGFLMYPGDGETLTKDQIMDLMPIMKQVMIKNNLDCELLVGDNNITIGKNTNMNNLMEAFNKDITEEIIVPQKMSENNGRDIRHRPLSFVKLNDDEFKITYMTFGDFNNFDVALNELKSIYIN